MVNVGKYPIHGSYENGMKIFGDQTWLQIWIGIFLADLFPWKILYFLGFWCLMSMLKWEKKTSWPLFSTGSTWIDCACWPGWILIYLLLFCDEQMSKWLGVKHLPVYFLMIFPLSFKLWVMAGCFWWSYPYWNSALRLFSRRCLFSKTNASQKSWGGQNQLPGVLWRRAKQKMFRLKIITCGMLSIWTVQGSK